MSRLLAWLEPEAAAKSLPGLRRTALWIDGAHVAVTGSDTLVGAQGRVRLQPAGAWLVDTRSWRARKLLAGTNSIARAGNTLLAYGGTPSSGGVTAFSPDGMRRFSLFRSGFPPGLLQVRGNYAYLADGSAMSWLVIDVRKGRVVARARTSHTTTLLDVR